MPMYRLVFLFTVFDVLFCCTIRLTSTVVTIVCTKEMVAISISMQYDVCARVCVCERDWRAIADFK